MAGYTFFRSNSNRRSNGFQYRLATIIALTLTIWLLPAGVQKEMNAGTAVEQYGEVKIGSQVWMSKNLDVATFQNGDPIPEAKTTEEWKKAGKEQRPAWCYYNNDPVIGKKYGRMYNWYAVNDPRGISPKGWHVPTLQEWTRFEELVEGKHSDLFDCGDSSAEPTGKSLRFCTLGGGYRFSNGLFTGLEEFTYLSGATEDKIEDSSKNLQPVLWGRGMHVVDRTIMRCGLGKDFGLYVRCLKD